MFCCNIHWDSRSRRNLPTLGSLLAWTRMSGIASQRLGSSKGSAWQLPGWAKGQRDFAYCEFVCVLSLGDTIMMMWYHIDVIWCLWCNTISYWCPSSPAWGLVLTRTLLGLFWPTVFSGHCWWLCSFKWSQCYHIQSIQLLHEFEGAVFVLPFGKKEVLSKHDVFFSNSLDETDEMNWNQNYLDDDNEVPWNFRRSSSRG